MATSALGLALLLALGGCIPTGARTPGASMSAASTSAASAAHGTGGLRPVGATEAARVVRVVDGDTLVIDRGLGNERLRYLGVDAPESVKPDSEVEFMGREASAVNAALVEGQTVVLERDVSDVDQYGRLLRYAWLRDGEGQGDGWLLVNLELVRQGYAGVVTFPPDVRWIDELRAAERVARDAGIGLWEPPRRSPERSGPQQARPATPIR